MQAGAHQLQPGGAAAREQDPDSPGAGLPGHGSAGHSLINSGPLTTWHGISSGLQPPSLDHGTAQPGLAAGGVWMRAQSLHFLCL